MGDCCNCNSEVSRDGSSQLSRYLKALDPSYAKVDDRSIEDLLVFAKRYANQIRFYDIPGSDMPGEEHKAKISWREFFRRDMAVIAASISLTDTDQVKKDYEELRAKLDANPAWNTYNDLFDPILGMAIKIDGWYSIAIPENPLYADLQLAINSNLKEQVKKIVAYEKGFNYVDASHPLNLDYSKIINKDLWGLNDTINADISIYQGTDTEDKIRNGALYIDDIFNNFYGFLNQMLANAESYLQFALQQYPVHQPHMALFLAFLQLFRLAQDQMNGITERMLDFYYRDVLHLTAKPAIPDKVHIVFELAKDVAEYDLTAGTSLKAIKDAGGKDQFYLTENDLVVNQAKVKEIKNIFIEKNDSHQTGANGTISTNQIINRIYARPAANSKDGFGEKFTDANPKWPTFGKGSSLSNTSNNLCDQVALLDDVNRTDVAQVGFAIASPQLVLQGGNRLLKIQLIFNDVFKTTLFEKAKSFETQNSGKPFFNVSLSGEKGWIDVQNILTQDQWDNLFIKYTPKGQTTVETLGIFNPDLDEIKTASYFLDDENNSIAVYLPPSEQGVINLDSKIHTGYNIQTRQPVVKILIDSSAGLDIDEYETLKLTGVQLRTKVGSINPSEQEQNDIIGSGQIPSAENLFTYHADGLKKLVLQNKDGVLSPDKPFDPFTAYPFPGRSFYIGSEEIFNKPFGGNTNDALAVNLQKTLDPADVTFSNETSTDIFNWENYTASILKKRQFIVVKDQNFQKSFTREELTENILNESVLAIDRTPVDTVTQWNSDTEKDFIKIDLREREAVVEIAARRSFLAAAAADNISVLQRSQNFAPGLEIGEVSVSYDSILRLEMGIDQFFHIYPFGSVETYLSASSLRNNNAVTNTSFAELDKLKNGLLVDAGNALLPQFDFLSPYSKYYNSISLYTIPSIKNLSALSNIRPDRIDIRSKSSTAVRLLLNARSDALNSSNQYTGDIQQGLLYIGIEKLQPLQSISMLFQFAEGSAEDEDDDPPAINWSYLANNEWRPLKAENIVSDGTYGFQTTGIIKMDIPADASSNNTIITDGLIWLCASVIENANRIPQLIDIVTQAVEAKFQDNDNDQSHFDNVLPAASISKLTTPVAEVSKVQQPFASFDGKHQEIGKEFYTRVSERLRHKGRAINAWDYEHLVLDRFPSVYKVKCITHTDPNCLCTNKSLTVVNSVLPMTILFTGDNATLVNSLNKIADEVNKNPLLNITLIGKSSAASGNIETIINAFAKGKLPTGENITIVDLSRISIKNAGGENADSSVDIVETESCCGPQIAPGHVLLIPIANLKNRNVVNPLQPKTSRRVLIEIQEYLKTHTSPFVHVHAKNPVYEQIIVSFKVQFYSGTDKGYYMKKLNEEIVHFLTPWAFDENAEVKFNQKIYASSIINFIEERNYVDFITDFVMGVCCNECCIETQRAGIGVINGTVFDNEKTQNHLEGITISIKELNKLVTTGSDGTYKVSNIPPGTYTLLAFFSLFNIAKQTCTINTDGTASPATIDFFEGAGNRQEDIEEYFTQFCGCNSVEKFLKYDPNFKGDIVAKPCTDRSILVSVPQHIIIPYEEDSEPTPCEKRQAAKLANVNITEDVSGVGNMTLKKEIAGETVVNKAAENTGTIKKAAMAKSSTAKSATSATSKKVKAKTAGSAVKPKKSK
ncbi:MAG: carboxypeptidase-like regulatory domain-containing protein [Ginsengibacter sp.]